MKGKLTKKIKGTSSRPRLAVFKSLKHISVQVIDDELGKTLAYASTIKKGGKKTGGKHWNPRRRSARK